MLRLHGIIPPIVTPLAEDERVDEAGLRRLVSRMLEGGVHGLFLLGSTGEQPALRESERDRAVRITVDEVGGRIPVVVGTMAGSTTRAIDNIAAAAAAGADGVAVTPPHYYPSRGADDQVAHYRAVTAASPVPVVIYNIPQTTKVMMSPEVIRDISALPNVVGVKDSSTDFSHFLKILAYRGANTNFACLIGAPTLLGPCVLFGGDGAVVGTGNLDPRLAVELYEAARRRDVDATVALQYRMAGLSRVIAHGAPIVCLKTALEMMGVCSARACAPFQPLTPGAKDAIAAVLREHELL